MFLIFMKYALIAKLTLFPFLLQACDRKLCPLAVPAGGIRGAKELICGGRGSCLSMEVRYIIFL
jgi:hypothetical protein